MKNKKISDKIKKQVFDELAGTSEDKEVAKKFKLTLDEVVDIMHDEGYISCPDCCIYIELGEMLSNPDDESEQACATCGENAGW